MKASVTTKLLENEQAQASIPQGNQYLFLVNTARAEFDGNLTLAFENLPAGVTAHVTDVPAGQTIVPVVVEAAADAPLAGTLANLLATHTPEGQEPIVGGFLQNVRLVPGDNDTTFYGWDVDRCAILAPRTCSTPGPNGWTSRPCSATRASPPPRWTPASDRSGWRR